jgi:NAD(P)-dependent dehydrogenase (short-subunit alcohol dehydrogenase family)
MNASRRVLVLGGAGGIGAAGVRALVAGGHHVVVADVAPVPADLGAELAIEADASDAVAVEAAVGEAARALGGLDAAWYHAGVQHLGTVEETDLDELDACYRLHVRGPIAFGRAVVPSLRRAGGGAVLFTASGAGVVVDRAAVPYTVTKSALVTLARLMALDHAGDHIRVNALCPGWVDTPFNAPAYAQLGGYEAFKEQVPDLVPIGRVAGPDEIGRLAAWLLVAEEASYITGQAVVADGGDTLRYGAR